MTLKMLSLLAIAAIYFTGCSLMPQYIRPKAPVPAAWPGAPAHKVTPATNLEWRKFFKDERLRKIIDTALQSNRDLRVAVLHVARARALYRIQRTEILPRLGAVGSGYQERVPADLSRSGSSMTAKEYSVNLGITSWEIDFFGRIRSLKQRALEEYLSTEHARGSAQILLVSEVANAYLTLAKDRENLQLARSTLKAQRASYNLIRRRFEVGLASKLDLRQVQTRVDTSRVDVARFSALTTQTKNALNLIVGSPVPADLLPETLSVIAPLPDISPGISSEVLLRRPDILQAESLLKAANANIGAARAALFPRISLTTAIGTASADLSGLFKSGSGTWMFAPQIAMPIFDPRAWSALKVTKVDMEIALAKYEGTIQAAFREVADALARRGTIGNQMEAQQSLVEATAEAYKIANARYEKGADSYLNVLDAQRSLYTAQQQSIVTRLTKLVNQVRFYAVLGGGSNTLAAYQNK